MKPVIRSKRKGKRQILLVHGKYRIDLVLSQETLKLLLQRPAAFFAFFTVAEPNFVFVLFPGKLEVLFLLYPLFQGIGLYSFDPALVIAE